MFTHRPTGRVPVSPARSAARWAIACLALLLGAPAALGQNATYYVRKSGSDSKNGLSPANAFLTIQKAVNSCSNTGGGYTVYVGPGIYDEVVAIGNRISGSGGGLSGTAGNSTASGTALAPNRLVGDDTGTHTGDAAGAVVIRGAATTRKDGLNVQGRDYWSFSNLTLRDQPRFGVFIYSGRGFSVTNCSIKPTGTYGVYAYACDVSVAQNVFLRDRTTASCIYLSANAAGSLSAQRNQLCITGGDYLYWNFYSNNHSRGTLGTVSSVGLSPKKSTYGIYVQGKSGSANTISIENNVGTDCYLGIFASAQSSAGATIRVANNTFTGCYYPLYLYAASTGAVIARNNVFTNSHFPVTGSAAAATIEGVLLDHISTGNTMSGVGLVSGSMTGDPLFRAASAGDLSPQTGSPAIDAGVPDNSALVDLTGEERPADGNYDGVPTIDLGAYERAPHERYRIVQAAETTPPRTSTSRVGTPRATPPGGGPPGDPPGRRSADTAVKALLQQLLHPPY